MVQKITARDVAEEVGELLSTMIRNMIGYSFVCRVTNKTVQISSSQEDSTDAATQVFLRISNWLVEQVELNDRDISAILVPEIANQIDNEVIAEAKNRGWWGH